ncbi:hypothetical protein GCM10010269_44380 [Streptomyces humidus]|uniref:Uncharacterized protein n=1 Tax=Streptomyces humidus TaxID=52259 RepID=A0A918L4D1_9ACTN|nr:hypothetical protein GCM10010269_44380 [Streptomyces humidus]
MHHRGSWGTLVGPVEGPGRTADAVVRPGPFVVPFEETLTDAQPSSSVSPSPTSGRPAAAPTVRGSGAPTTSAFLSSQSNRAGALRMASPRARLVSLLFTA